MKKRILGVMLSLCMILSLLPMTALAVEVSGGSGGSAATTNEALAALKSELATAQSGATVTLSENITIGEADLAGQNQAVITIPVGVTLDGNGKTITATGWTSNNKCHILSVENATENTTTTIENLTIMGNENTKSGIHAYNCSGTVKLKDVTIQNCGNAALQINNAKVEASGLTTSGNAWGAVNVDVKANLTNESASFKLESGTLNEPAKIWTEKTVTEDDPSVTIEVPEDWAAKALVSADGKTYYADKVPVMIGETGYPTLRDAALAAANAQSTVDDKTITLNDNVTVNDVSADELGVNNAVITLPDGWTLDGQDHTITAATNWSKDSKHSILGVTAATTGVTIENVTIVGNANTRHGINAWTATVQGGTAGKLELTNVTIENCGTAGMVVQNTEVTATGLTTSGNAWGAVNVDSKGTPKLILTNANLGENVQVWTELTTVGEKIKIDDNAFQQVKGEGGPTDLSGLKGFTYYTTDPAKLGEASITEEGVTTVYTTLGNALVAAQAGDEVDLLKDVNITNPITIDKKITLNGNEKTLTCSATTPNSGGAINVTADGVTVKNLDINSSKNYGVQFYNVAGGTLDKVNITGGVYTSVYVNASGDITIKDSKLNPTAPSYYTCIEYGMGAGDNLKLPGKLTIDGVSGNNPVAVWTDASSTAKMIAASNGTLTADNVAGEINKNIVNKNSGSIKVNVAVTKGDGENAKTEVESSTKPGTYTGGGGGGGGSVGYTVTVDKTTNGTVTVSPKNASKGSTVTITVTPDQGYELDKVTVTDKNGDVVKVTAKGGDKFTFTMPDSKVNVSASFVKTADQPTTGFVDVPANAYFADAVQWAVDKKITTGTSATTFSPNASCTRGQMVTFLWRAAGSPAATGENPFADVKADAYYYDAVLWAVQKGITIGVTATTFAPEATVTRGQTVTFLYRNSGTPAATGNAFTDVAADAYYANAVAWAVAEKITNGTSDTTFSPESDCTRGQIVTFLYRDAT